MIYFLIPSYNDSSNFKNLIKNINDKVKTKKKIVIVDDGSTDNSAAVIDKLPAREAILIGYRKNKGPGYAFKFGFKYLIPKLKINDLVVTLEADNTSDYSILPLMIRKTSKYDVVLSSPYAKGGKFKGISKTRQLLSVCANLLDRFVLQLDIRTTSSFYRVYRAAILKKAIGEYKNNFITENGFTAVVEMLIKLRKVNARFIEIPSVVDWSKRSGKSKMKIIKTIYGRILLYKNHNFIKYTRG